jgi:hypothetical protein
MTSVPRILHLTLSCFALLIAGSSLAQSMPAIDIETLQAPKEGLRLTTEMSIGTGRPVFIGAQTVAGDPLRDLIGEHGVLALTVSKRLTDSLDMSVGVGGGTSRGFTERQSYISPLSVGLSYVLSKSIASRSFLSGSASVYEPGNYGSKDRFLGSVSLGLSRTDVIDPVYVSYGTSLQLVRKRRPEEITPYRAALTFHGSLGFAANHRVQLSAGTSITQSFRQDDRLFGTDRRTVGLSFGAALAHADGGQTSVSLGFNPSRGDASLSLAHTFQALGR